MGWRAAPSFSLIDYDDFGEIPFHFSRQHSVECTHASSRGAGI